MAARREIMRGGFMSMTILIRRFILTGAICFFLAFVSSLAVRAQVSLPPSSPYTQDFDSLGTTATATLPAGWKVDKQATVRTVGTYAAAVTTTERRDGNGMANNAANGIYNYGAGDEATATDRAVGWISAGSGTQSGNLYAQFLNDTGQLISSVSISYNVEKYRNGSNPAGFQIQMYYSLDGASWISAGPAFLTSFPADANSNGFAAAPGATLSISNQLLNVTVAVGGDLFLAWNYSVTSGTTISSAQALGIDDFSIVANAAPTAIDMDSFNAVQTDKGVFLEWRTGYERNNLGFNIYRETSGKRTRINSSLVAGSALRTGANIALTAGQSYAWFDAIPKDADFAVYWIEDIDLNGKSRLHGPLIPTRSDEIPPETAPLLLGRLRSPATVDPFAERQVPPSIALQPSPADILTQWDIAAKPGIKLSIQQAGWFRVTQPELVAAGLDPETDPRLLQLFVDGRQIPILVNGESIERLEPGDSIEFYATPLDTLWTDAHIYWLVRGDEAGLRLIVSPGLKAPPGTAQNFPFTIERKERINYFDSLKNGDADNFFGPAVTDSAVSQDLILTNLDTLSSGQAILEVALQGVTSLPDSTPDHIIRVLLNEADLGTISFDGQAHAVSSFAIPASLLIAGNNTVSLRAEGGSTDVSLIDYIRLTYPHTFRADDNTLMFSFTGQEEARITGFDQTDIRVFDITDPNMPKEIIGSIEADGKEFAIRVASPDAGARVMLAVSDENLNHPAAITPNQPSTWNKKRQGADMVVITYRDFADQVAPLVTLRQSQHLAVAVIDVEDLYDEFNYGARSPFAVRDFLACAKSNWKKPPRFVLLVGDSSFDPRNHLGFGDWDLVPTRLVETSVHETASDDWLVDFNADGVPEMAVGRLPARTRSEAETMIEKLIRFDQQGRSTGVLMVTDRNDGFDFEAASRAVRDYLPGGVAVEEVFRSQMSDTEARAQIILAINRGKILVNYAGHGSLGLWRGGLFAREDAATLTNQNKLSLFLTMTCLNGLFQDPHSDSLAEALMKSEGGAVAVWASSALTAPDAQAQMNRELYRQLFAVKNRTGQPVTIGEAIIKAKQAINDPDVRRTWILFGDPSLPIR